MKRESFVLDWTRKDNTWNGKTFSFRKEKLQKVAVSGQGRDRCRLRP